MKNQKEKISLGISLDEKDKMLIHKILYNVYSKFITKRQSGLWK